MMPDSSHPALACAWDEIRQVREWLLRPSAATLTSCGPALERAIRSIQELLPSLKKPAEQSRDQLAIAARDLAGEIQELQTLLRAAGDLYFSRLRRLTPDG
jgi:hypothetical protein